MASLTLDTALPETASEGLRAMAQAALAGGEIARQTLRRRDAGEMIFKGRHDYQTQGDLQTEEVIVAELQAAFPGCGIIGEEQVGDRTAEADRPTFVIDPIDGTTNYAWGIPHFGVVITRLEGGEVVAGITYDPMMGEMFAAEKGQGAWLNGQRLDATGTGDVENSVIGAGLPIRGQVQSVPDECYHAALRRAMDNTSGVRRLGSSALSIAYVAAGRLDGFFEDMLSLVDYGASVLILREAGGVVTGFDGGDIRSPGAILAGSAGMHPWLLEGFAAG
ncbi:inositol monophosphatase family protein [Salipiger sp. PrR002]|uniref:inositol monophosphatase family protein n=1 Tax=Salipiger sp. PrR002 TaxID=2706489 RepID=UPI0013B62C38|nr:inositol monophosphatase family protein [Salipiger sp. PrR002]NDW00862.1 inositol monophosphatase [Salipiger sp. PrR002]NDW58017.1 inositol monophosphatase [Salipiger sp. PrR004]